MGSKLTQSAMRFPGTGVALVVSDRERSSILDIAARKKNVEAIE